MENFKLDKPEYYVIILIIIIAVYFYFNDNDTAEHYTGKVPYAKFDRRDGLKGDILQVKINKGETRNNFINRCKEIANATPKARGFVINAVDNGVDPTMAWIKGCDGCNLSNIINKGDRSDRTVFLKSDFGPVDIFFGQDGLSGDITILKKNKGEHFFDFYRRCIAISNGMSGSVGFVMDINSLDTLENVTTAWIKSCNYCNSNSNIATRTDVPRTVFLKR